MRQAGNRAPVNTPATIAGFLRQIGAESMVFDVGRRVIKLGRRPFEAFEQAQQPYPLPFRQEAWFGVVFWRRKARAESLIWFLKLPLDERGLLIPAARDAFLHSIMDAANTLLTQGAAGTDTESMLASSPYTFRPTEERLAVFHAKAARALRQPASQYYDHARRYCAGHMGYKNWSDVGLQGLADIAARWDQNGNGALLEQGLPCLPPQPLGSLCCCLENEAISASITRVLTQRMAAELAAEPPDSAVLAAGIRAMSFSPAAATRRRQLLSILDSASGGTPAVLAAISSRSWQDLEDDRLRGVFLERLAANREGQTFFNGVMADLLYLPGMRAHFFKDFRDPSRSERLSRAIGRLFSAYSPR